MDNMVQDEMFRVHALKRQSDFEYFVSKDIFGWASKVYGNDALNMTFQEMVEAYWSDYMEDS